MTRGIFVGLSTIDVVYKVDEFPSANSKIVARGQDLFAGGPATNAAIAFAHLGGQPMLVTALGRHPLAAAIREELARYGVQLLDLHPDFDGPPALSSVSVDRRGNRNVVSANATRIPAPPAEVDLELCKRARVLLADAIRCRRAWPGPARRGLWERRLCWTEEAGKLEPIDCSTASIPPSARPISCLPAAPAKTTSSPICNAPASDRSPSPTAPGGCAIAFSGMM
jgi:hypothetical protein